MGHASVGDLTYESAAYVSRYIMKKVNGSLKNLIMRLLIMKRVKLLI